MVDELKRLYMLGLYTKEMIEEFLNKGVITPDDFEYIVKK